MARSRAAELRDLVARRQAALGTFNIVLFGRTGAGKSSLVEAFTRGDGSSVSPGDSDWTTKVTDVNWERGPGCRFWDTPGTNGWGRTVSREKLEAEACAAVEVADIVLLCFDDQGQQQGEFDKIAAWVIEHGKPSIAVLNCRNQRWRLPQRVPYAEQRRTISKPIREHAGNIRDELARVGLLEVPVVTLSSQRALFGRATPPYVGPAGKSFASLRSEFGPDLLEHASNFPALSDLLVELLKNHARTIRLGMLERGASTALDGLEAMMGEFTKTCGVGLEQLEKLIATTFEVVGYPDEDERRLLDSEDGCSLLDDLETRRGGPFQQAEDGRFGQYVRRRLNAALGKLRTESMGRAEEHVIDAFERTAAIDAATLQESTYSEDRILRAGREVLEASAGYLKRELSLVAEDGRLDLECLLHEVGGVDGQAGRGMRWAGNAGIAAGILSGLAGAAVPIAIALSWTPFGWAAGAVAILGGIGSMLFGWLGRSARKKAAVKALKARRAALANVRKAVHATYDGFQAKVEAAAVRQGLKSASGLLLPTFHGALALHDTLGAVAQVRDRLGPARAQLRVKHSAQRAVATVAEALPRARFPDEPHASSLLWLGESWIEDPAGLRPPLSPSPRSTEAYQPGLFERLFSSFQIAFRVWKDPLRPGTGRDWFAELERDELLAKEAPDLFVALRAWCEGPRLQFAGDYSAGKSSFIKRLLVDDGQPVPEDLSVRGDPTTVQAAAYPWQDVLLVDTPGFQSSRSTDTKLATDVLPQAAALVVLLQPNLLVGDTRGLKRALRGDRSAGIAPKLDRTLFVINRADDLGLDPQDDPKGFRRAVERKRQELVVAMASRGIKVDPNRVLAMASDPFGMVGDRRDVDSRDYDAYRAWDGFDHFARAFREIRPQLLRNGCDRSVLEGGLAELAQEDRRRAEEHRRLAACSMQLRRVEQILRDGLAEGARLRAARAADFRRMTEDHAFGLLEGVIECDDEEELDGEAALLKEWWSDPAFGVEVERWQTVYVKEVDQLVERLERALERRLSSAGFRAAFPDLEETNEIDGLEPGGGGWVRTLLKVVEAPLKGANRDLVYRVVKFFGGKFKPWGAIKLTRSVVKVGGIIAVVGVVLDVGDAVMFYKREAKREAARKQLRDLVQGSAEELIKLYTQPDESLGGPITYLAARMGAIGDRADEIRAGQDAGQRSLNAVRELRGRIEAHSKAAWTLLGHPSEEEV
jgi:predicted GTPase